MMNTSTVAMKLFEENEKLVDFVINRYYRNIIEKHGEIYEDMKQVGLLSLYNATRKFDESKNVKFSTFAVNIIKNDFHNFVRLDLYRYVQRDEVDSMNKKMQEDENSTLEDFIGVYDDTSELENGVLEYLKENKSQQVMDIITLLVQGYSTVQIAEKLELTKQRVSKVICDLKKELVEVFDIRLKKEDGRIMAMDREGNTMEFDNVAHAVKVLGVRKYSLKDTLMNRKFNSFLTCSKVDKKMCFRWL